MASCSVIDPLVPPGTVIRAHLNVSGWIFEPRSHPPEYDEVLIVANGEIPSESPTNLNGNFNSTETVNVTKSPGLGEHPEEEKIYEKEKKVHLYQPLSHTMTSLNKAKSVNVKSPNKLKASEDRIISSSAGTNTTSRQSSLIIKPQPQPNNGNKTRHMRSPSSPVPFTVEMRVPTITKSDKSERETLLHRSRTLSSLVPSSDPSISPERNGDVHEPSQSNSESRGRPNRPGLRVSVRTLNVALHPSNLISISLLNSLCSRLLLTVQFR